jgi:GTPase SAR1 family protein
VKENLADCEKYLNLSKEHDSKLPSILLLNKKDLVDEGYLQEINKSLPEIKVLQSKYNLVKFLTVSAKTQSSTEFLNIFESFVKEAHKNTQLSSI